jgi:hypothetical protein
MRTPRYVLFILAIAVGIALGLLYGWVLSPIELVDTNPATLRDDFKTDYVLMVAEAYSADHDLNAAICQLALLGGNPGQAVDNATVFGVEVGYSPEDLVLLNDLSAVLKTWEPGQEVCE